jgi:hypothetical protein
MYTLRDVQSAVQAAIAEGPQAIDSAVFKGPPARILLGLKAHANTVSHARLIALEETFPLTRDAIGHARFNTVSRTFLKLVGLELTGLDRESWRLAPLAQIGRDFPNALIGAGVAQEYIFLARYEWAWLQSFHAAEAAPLMLIDLQDKAEAEILLIRVRLHPATRIVTNCRAIPGHYNGDRLLITRPSETMEITSINAVAATLCAVASVPAALGDVLTRVLIEHPEGDLMAALLALINAGAFCLDGDFAADGDGA